MAKPVGDRGDSVTRTRWRDVVQMPNEAKLSNWDGWYRLSGSRPRNQLRCAGNAGGHHVRIDQETF